MTNTVLDQDRVFKVWDFHITHSRLLLRSPRDKQHEQNIDVIFYGVAYIEMPTLLNGIELEQPTKADLEKMESVLGREVPQDEVHVLSSQGGRFVLVAISKKITANDLDIFESSLAPV